MPLLNATPNVPLDAHLVSLVSPMSFEAEQYRRLRHRVEELNLSRGLRVLAVTSAVASDGKTLTAINLAGALAQGDSAKVLLIDADLRQPAIAHRLGLTQATGTGLLAALEATTGSIEQFARPSGTNGLSVLAVDDRLRDPYERLASPRFLELLSEARHRYDYVIVDTPPVIAVPDGNLFRRAVDGYLLVVAANKTPRKLVGEALNLLDPASVVGLVLNRDDRPLFGYYRRHYRAYFKKYAEAVGS